jgi:hypothetical protein
MGAGFNSGLPNTDIPAKKQKVKEFLSSSTWKRPAGVDCVEVLLVGGGGGGGGLTASPVSQTAYASGSGGGGGVVRKLIDITSVAVGASISVTIGAGGAAGTTAGTAGGVGGNTSFGSLLTALGGGGGDGQPTASGVSTGIATCGGGKAAGGTYYSQPGFGGGAGGAPMVSGAQAKYLANPIIPGTQGIASSTSILGPAINGSSYLGFGAGGGGGGGAGAANTGNGGAGVADQAATGTISSAGYTGGSGYVLVSWWE